MIFQQISTGGSVLPVQTQAAASSGADSSTETPFLSVMQLVSDRTAAQPTAQRPAQGTDASTDGPQAKPDGQGQGTVFSGAASALAALFAAQAVRQIPIQSAAPANAAQPTQAPNSAAGPVSALSVLFQAQQLPGGAKPASSAAAAQGLQTAAEGPVQSSVASPLPMQAAANSGTKNQTPALLQTARDAEAVPVAASQSGNPIAPDGTAAPQAQVRQAFSESDVGSNPPVLSDQSVPQAKILSIETSQTQRTQEQGTAPRTGTLSTENSGSSTVLTGVSAVPSTRSVPQPVKAGGVQTGDAGRNGRDEQTSFQTGQASTAAALYASGKVVVRISGKTAQTSQTALTGQTAQAAAPAAQVADSVANGYRNGLKQMTVDLYPESLGKVSVKLTSKDGLLTVQLAADNVKTQDLIASSSGDIRSLLQNATGQNVQVVRPDPSAAQQWYAQDGSSGNRNRQQSGGQKQDAKESPSGGIEAISTDDFLSIMRKAAGA